MSKICIGKIVNTHGIKGEVKILSKVSNKDKIFIMLVKKRARVEQLSEFFWQIKNEITTSNEKKRYILEKLKCNDINVNDDGHSRTTTYTRVDGPIGDIISLIPPNAAIVVCYSFYVNLICDFC